MSSIYDDPAPKPQTSPPNPFAATEPIQPSDAYAPPFAQQTPPPQKKSGWGCVGCLLGCLGVLIVLAIVVGIGTYFVVKKIPDFARQTIIKGIEESELKPEDKRMVIEQVDRLVEGYKNGKIDFEGIVEFGQDFSESPLMDLLVAFAAKVKYIDKSNLSAEEKAEAEKTLQRVARGVIEKKITQEQVDGALNHISTKVPNGGRQFKEEVTDDELRAFLTDCQRLADEAMVSDEDIQVDIGGELKKLVDRALGEAPAEEPEVKKAEPSKPVDTKSADPKLEQEKNNAEPAKSAPATPAESKSSVPKP